MLNIWRGFDNAPLVTSSDGAGTGKATKASGYSACVIGSMPYSATPHSLTLPSPTPLTQSFSFDTSERDRLEREGWPDDDVDVGPASGCVAMRCVTATALVSREAPLFF